MHPRFWDRRESSLGDLSCTRIKTAVFVHKPLARGLFWRSRAPGVVAPFFPC